MVPLLLLLISIGMIDERRHRRWLASYVDLLLHLQLYPVRSLFLIDDCMLTITQNRMQSKLPVQVE